MGIWEVRGGQQQFVYSKVQCWVALDRAIRLAQEAEPAAGPHPPGRGARTASTRPIHDARPGTRSGRPSCSTFATDAVDASNLIMPARLLSCRRPNPPHARDAGSDHGGAGFRQPSAPATRSAEEPAMALTGERGDVSICVRFWLVESAGPGGAAPEEGPLHLREDADLRQPPSACTPRETGPCGEALGNLPAGIHSHRVDKRRVQPGPAARRGGLE